MGKINSFFDLEVYREAHVLTLYIYKITSNFPRSEIFGITSQLRRASVSIESCIAEGFSRFHYKERIKFYFDARGSISEVQAQAKIVLDIGYITKKEFDSILTQTTKIQIILNGLIRSTKRLSNM